MIDANLKQAHCATCFFYKAVVLACYETEQVTNTERKILEDPRFG